MHQNLNSFWRLFVWLKGSDREIPQKEQFAEIAQIVICNRICYYLLCLILVTL